MNRLSKGDPVIGSLIGDDRIEWLASPNWDLAERPQRHRVWFRIMLVVTFVTSVCSILLILKHPSLKDGSSDRPIAIALMAIAFWITGYAWLHLARCYFRLKAPPFAARQVRYILTDKKLIVLPGGSDRLLVQKEDYWLSRASLKPNGLVHDLELLFEHKNRRDTDRPMGPIMLRALDNAETIKDVISQHFSTAPARQNFMQGQD
ncbi:hypothetical protein [Cohaesibacter marisflavi]|uniref:hypothetical protein n=1 Tax=Cohaesibacter marisflavi TaxID=655353 RepID=UPI0029C891FA|nr:hypothetical protein [Cohaesibacter marisflavi]